MNKCIMAFAILMPPINIPGQRHVLACDVIPEEWPLEEGVFWIALKYRFCSGVLISDTLARKKEILKCIENGFIVIEIFITYINLVFQFAFHSKIFKFKSNRNTNRSKCRLCCKSAFQTKHGSPLKQIVYAGFLFEGWDKHFIDRTVNNEFCSMFLLIKQTLSGERLGPLCAPPT